MLETADLPLPGSRWSWQPRSQIRNRRDISVYPTVAVFRRDHVLALVPRSVELPDELPGSHFSGMRNPDWHERCF
jgi:hypothetical protein